MARITTSTCFASLVLLALAAPLSATPPASIPAEFKLWLETGTIALVHDSRAVFNSDDLFTGCHRYDQHCLDRQAPIAFASPAPDKYWLYYGDCDRWGVVFSVGRFPTLRSTEVAEQTINRHIGLLWKRISGPIVSTFESARVISIKLAQRSLKNFEESLIAQYKVLEFNLVETSKHGRSVSSPAKPSFILASARKMIRPSDIQEKLELSLADHLEWIAAECQTVSQQLRKRSANR